MAATLHRILCPIDFTEPSLAAMRWAAILAGRLAVDIDVLHVCPPPPEGTPPQASVAHREAVEKLRAALAEARRLFPRAGSRIAEGEARKVITDLSKQYDLVVMSTHGRTGLARVVLGSIAEHVLRNASCPVLTMREGLPSNAVAP